MKSKAHPNFWVCFEKLPADIQSLAKVKYRLWMENPAHPSLRFKLLREDVWSVRINRNYRALAVRDGDLVTWFWIGTHKDYDRMTR